MNTDTLTVYYGVKQSQFTKTNSKTSVLEILKNAFDRAIRDWYCSITVTIID